MSASAVEPAACGAGASVAAVTADAVGFAAAVTVAVAVAVAGSAGGVVPDPAGAAAVASDRTANVGRGSVGRPGVESAAGCAGTIGRKIA
ncbi:hypothetical protein [Micromonospora sp. NPDC049679]|uniref:hypothetical protein n=1 Tax=Micromonospora sp. NPDC049679 TaxID=3155920 RepID=UPI0033CA3047